MEEEKEGKKGDRSHTAQQGAAAAERELPERKEKLFKKIGNVATKVHFRTKKKAKPMWEGGKQMSVYHGYRICIWKHEYSERVILALESCLERRKEVKGSKDKRGRT